MTIRYCHDSSLSRAAKNRLGAGVSAVWAGQVARCDGALDGTVYATYVAEGRAGVDGADWRRGQAMYQWVVA